jgi:type IV pilus assembly protein PilX
MIRSPRRQQGVVLFIALIILVAMSLAGIALMRSVDTGTIIAGNLAFRQSTTYVADLGVEAARAWLRAATAADLEAHQEASGYYATWDSVDLLKTFAWTDAISVNVTGAPFTPPTGYTVRYVIHRLCSETGDPATKPCVKMSGAGGSGTSTGSKGAVSYGAYALAAPVPAVYRITVLVTGPRNARSFVQAVVL